jgi:hypothetical protein
MRKLILEDKVEDEKDTETFIDAFNEDFSLSEEEDVSLVDLELDEEYDYRQHRKSDINIDGQESPKNLANKFLSKKILKKPL